MQDARAIPGPKGQLLLGNLGDFAKSPLEYLRSVAQTYGDVSQLHFGKRRMFLINQPDYIREILVSKPGHFKKGLALQISKPILGNGLLTSEGEEHRRHRKMMQPAFHMQRVREYGDTMVQLTTQQLDTWHSGEIRSISRDMMNVTLRIISKTMFGHETASESEGIGRALDVFMEDVMKRLGSLVSLPRWIPTKRQRSFRTAAAYLDSVIYGVLDQRRQSEDRDTGDLMSMLLAARDDSQGLGMTDDEIKDEVMTIFLAGHETTANTMTWTWYLLSQNPAVEETLHEEIHRVLGGRAPTFADIPNLTYTNLVIKESMRLYPAAWTVGYEAITDVEVGPWRFHQGDGFFMSQYIMHRNPIYYDNPDAFIPERWTEDFTKSLPSFAYFPFGGGPRICIGNQFALMEAALLLATIAQRYRLEYVDTKPPVPNPQITLRPTEDVRMRVVARNVE